jgi:CO dehydrogenase/acetyl-CoA synthase epsilon subunit
VSNKFNFTPEIDSRCKAMISQDYDSIYAVNELLRQIRIKEIQLKIAEESNMLNVTTALQTQLLELRHQLSESQDSELQALMSLLED